MKNILLLAHDDLGQEARFQAALDVCRAVDGHLTCLDVAVPMLIADDSFGSVATAALLSDEVKREQLNRAKMEARLNHEDVSWTWIDSTGQLAPTLRRHATLADVIVVSRELDDFPLPDMEAVAADVIVRSGKPVLAVPEHHERLDLSVALVAWDGSSAAAGALRAAIPLLRLAERVIVVEVDGKSHDTPGEDVAIYLSRHGIHARVEWVQALDAGVARTILDAAARHHAGYIVMGGFGHSRLREALFGGVTREMMSSSSRPLFLAH
ncbi:MAG: universal stress protein [Pseudomonadota bacterium]